MKKGMNARRRKGEILLCILLLAWMGLVTMKAQRLYLDPEKAFWESERLAGIGPSEKILLQKEDEEKDMLYMIGRLEQEKTTEFMTLSGKEADQTAGWLSVVYLEKVGGIFWREKWTSTEYFYTELQAWYNDNMEMMLGFCRNPDIKEVTMVYGHTWEQDGTWAPHVLGEGIYEMDADGFFYQEIDTSKALHEHEEDKFGLRAVNVLYMEGRDKDGTILYRHGIDKDGTSWTDDRFRN